MNLKKIILMVVLIINIVILVNDCSIREKLQNKQSNESTKTSQNTNSLDLSAKSNDDNVNVNYEDINLDEYLSVLEKYKTNYVGDSSKVVNLVSNLLIKSPHYYNGIELVNEEDMNGIIINYPTKERYVHGVASVFSANEEEYEQINAFLLFYYIDNLDFIYTTYDYEPNESSEKRDYIYFRTQFQEILTDKSIEQLKKDIQNWDLTSCYSKISNSPILIEASKDKGNIVFEIENETADYDVLDEFYDSEINYLTLNQDIVRYADNTNFIIEFDDKIHIQEIEQLLESFVYRNNPSIELRKDID